MGKKIWSESDEYGMPLDGTELADYEEVIRVRTGRYGEDDLMQYFDGSESIQEKDTKCKLLR